MVVVLVPLLALGGCGRPRQERIEAALDEARPRLEEIRSTLRLAESVLPGPEIDDDARGCFAEKMVPIVADLRIQTSAPGNMDEMMVADVAAPWGESHAPQSVARSLRLARPMGWALGGVAVGEGVSVSAVKSALAAALEVRYVLLYRVREYQAPRALTVREFTGGRIVCDFFVVDLVERKVQCVLPCVGKNGENLWYLRPQGSTAAERVASFQKVLDDNLFLEARRDAHARLRTLQPATQIVAY